MKKSFLILLLPLLLAGCGGNEATDHSCIDNDNDHLCDVCSKKLSNCIDEDEDGICDICGNEFVPTLTGITIKKQPAKTKYYVGEVFDPTGMVVNAQFDDGSYAPVTDYTYTTKELVLTDKSVTISYEGFEATVIITVAEKQSMDEEEYTATINLHGSKFATNFPEGTNFDNVTKFEALFEYIDDQLEYYELISEITCTKCASRKVNGDTFFQIGTGSPAKDKFNEGTFNYSSDVKIYKVEITAFNYSNPYQDWQTGETVHNVDNLGHLVLDDLDTSFEIAANEAPVTKTIVKEYAEGTNGFTLKAIGGRMLVSEMKITWRG